MRVTWWRVRAAPAGPPRRRTPDHPADGPPAVRPPGRPPAAARLGEVRRRSHPAPRGRRRGPGRRAARAVPEAARHPGRRHPTCRRARTGRPRAGPVRPGARPVRPRAGPGHPRTRPGRESARRRNRPPAPDPGRAPGPGRVPRRRRPTGTGATGPLARRPVRPRVRRTGSAPPTAAAGADGRGPRPPGRGAAAGHPRAADRTRRRMNGPGPRRAATRYLGQGTAAGCGGAAATTCTAATTPGELMAAGSEGRCQRGE